ncbi:MAG: PD40 domain-containing protein [Acidobacteria bacterium]|nr:PD40 domain-containing protein [Acidobacteriota bacterium]
MKVAGAQGVLQRPERQDVIQHVERILATPQFARSERTSQFLRFIMDKWLDGREAELKEYLIGTEVFSRGETFDSRTDPVVRTQAHRLRAALQAYYEEEGAAEVLRIEVPKGSYVPQVRAVSVEPAPIPSSEAPVEAKRSWKRYWLIAAVVMALAAGYFGIPRGEPPFTNRIESVLRIPAEAQLLPDSGIGSLSPNGVHYVFPAAKATGEICLWLRTLSRPGIQALPGTDGASLPFWSPDSREVAFFAQQKLKRILLSDSTVQVIGLAPQPRGGSWNQQGQILFAAQSTGPLHMVSSSGGAAVQATALDSSRAENLHRWPWFLPGGKNFLLYVRSLKPGLSGIYFGTLSGGDRPATTRLLIPMEEISAAEYAESPDRRSGYLVYQQAGAIFATLFDPGKGTLTGKPELVATGTPQTGAATCSFSTAGTRYMLITPSLYRSSQPTWFDRDGRRHGTLGEARDYGSLRIAPDGMSVAMEGMDTDYGTRDISIVDIASGASRLVTTDPSNDGDPVFTPDGKQMFFQSGRSGLPLLYRQNLLASESAERVDAAPDHSQFPQDISSKGLLLYQVDRTETQFDLWTRTLTGAGVAVTNGKGNERWGRFSPDGTMIAYTSDESGQDEVYVRELGANPRRWRISMSGGGHPRWVRSGKELFFIAGEPAVAAVSIHAPDSTGIADSARILFRQPTLVLRRGKPVWDISADGKRFLMAVPARPPEDANLRFLVNWSTRQ